MFWHTQLSTLCPTNTVLGKVLYFGLRFSGCTLYAFCLCDHVWLDRDLVIKMVRTLCIIFGRESKFCHTPISWNKNKVTFPHSSVVYELLDRLSTSSKQTKTCPNKKQKRKEKRWCSPYISTCDSWILATAGPLVILKCPSVLFTFFYF